MARRVCRDPDDDQVLALVLAAKAELIVSGDADLLSLVTFEGIPIVAPAEANARKHDQAPFSKHTARASIARPSPTGPIFSAVFAFTLT